MKKLIKFTLMTVITFSTLLNPLLAEEYLLSAKWKNVHNHFNSIDNSQKQEKLADLKLKSGIELHYERSGANARDYFVANTPLSKTALREKLLATGQFDYITFNQTTVMEKLKVVAKNKGINQIHKSASDLGGLPKNAFNDPLFLEETQHHVHQPYAMGLHSFFAANEYVEANKTLNRKVRVAIFDTGSWQHEDIEWANDEASFLTNKGTYDCAKVDETNQAADIVCADEDLREHVRSNNANAKLWTYTKYDEDRNPIGDATLCLNGHGLKVAGAVAAKRNNNLGIAGTTSADDVELVPVRVIACRSVSTFDVVDAIYWAAGMSVPGVDDISSPVDVINMSFGGVGSYGKPCHEGYQEAIDYANSKGIVIVAAAGNSIMDAAQFNPAGCERVLTVGAHSFTGELESYSNRGERVDVTMLGNVHVPFINNALYENSNSELCTNQYGEVGSAHQCYGGVSGTSIAAPLASALAAQIKMVRPDATSAEIRTIIKSTAKRYDELENGNTALRSYEVPKAGIGHAYDAVSSTFDSTLIESATLKHKYQDDTQAKKLFVEELIHLSSSEAVCNQYQATWGYYDVAVPGLTYKIYGSNVANEQLTTDNSQVIVFKGSDFIEFPKVSWSMKGFTRSGVQACTEQKCGDIFEFDFSQAQQPSICVI